MNNKVLIIFLLTVLFSCRKEEETFVISGVIMRDCNSIPMANEEFELYSYGDTWTLNRNVISESFKTDALGAFQVEYQSKYLKSSLEIKYKGEIFFLTPGNGCIGTIVMYPTINLLTNVKINNSYSPGDTLRILENNREINKFSYPFNDTVLDTLKNHFGNSQYNEVRDKDTRLKVYSGLSYRVDSGQRFTTSYKIKKTGGPSQSFDGCTNKIYKVEIEVD